MLSTCIYRTVADGHLGGQIPLGDVHEEFGPVPLAVSLRVPQFLLPIQCGSKLYSVREQVTRAVVSRVGGYNGIRRCRLLPPPNTDLPIKFLDAVRHSR